MPDDPIETQIIVSPPLPTVSRPDNPNRRYWALNIIGIGVVLGLCYFGELVLVVMLVSVLLAFILAPAVELMMRVHLPRSLASAIAVALLLAMVVGTIYFSYNQAATLFHDLPNYADKIRDQVTHFRQQAEDFHVLSPQQDKGSFQSGTNWSDMLSRGFGSASQIVLAASFVPFLVYFMLSWQHHVRSATVMLFPMDSRNTAYVTLGLISSMIRSFMVGNLLIGLFIGAVSTGAFWILNVPFFYFVGFASGFLSLVPYLGVVLAMAPPIFVSLGHAGSGGILSIMVIVLGLHLVALNVLYPKFLGNRLQLNPLAVTMSLLVWAWLWGAAGLLLAVPITAAMKIIFDHVESLKPYGSWLGE
jgi:predicted PurR-regulated permease PerM